MLTKVDIRQMDLNLLPKFRALYHRRSVSAAARDLFLTQSAVSNALAKMRQLFGDELFVRTSDGMMPTALAHAIRETVEPALGLIEGGLEKAGSFDPERCGRTFKVAMSQLAECLLFPHLVRAAIDSAPGVNVESMPPRRNVSAEDLRSGLVDAVIGLDVFAGGSSVIASATLAHCERVAIMRAEHPMAEADVATIADSCQLVHADDSNTEVAREHGTGSAGCRFRTANMLSVPALVAATDLVGMVPAWLAAMHASALGLIVKVSPFDADEYALSMSWHPSSDTDHGHQWLRNAFAAAAVSAGLAAAPQLDEPRRRIRSSRTHVESVRHDVHIAKAMTSASSRLIFAPSS